MNESRFCVIFVESSVPNTVAACISALDGNTESLQQKFCGPTLSRNLRDTPSKVMHKFIGAVA